MLPRRQFGFGRQRKRKGGRGRAERGRERSSHRVFSSWGCHQSSASATGSFTLPNLREGADTEAKGCPGLAKKFWRFPRKIKDTVFIFTTHFINLDYFEYVGHLLRSTNSDSSVSLSTSAGLANCGAPSSETSPAGNFANHW